MKKLKFIIVISVCFLCSCNEGTKQIVKSTREEPTIEGQYYDVKNYPIKLFLPKGYSRIERSDLLRQAQTIENEFIRKQLIKSIELQVQKKIDRQYLFSEHDGSMISLAEIPYMPLNINVASQLLGLIELENQQIYEHTDWRRILIDKKFKSNKSLKIFKAVYQTESMTNNEILAYMHLYVLEIKNRLYVINLEVPYEVNYEPYFAKTRIL